MSPSRDVYRERMYENKGFPELIGLIPPQQKHVLDVGCGNGANLSLMKQRGLEGIGLTLSDEEARFVRTAGFLCQVWDVNQQELPFPPESFDALVFCHVLEHLPWPEDVLRRYTALLRRGGGAYIVLPNALQFSQRWQFMMGRFRYTETGLMDRTHLRFFDFVTARQLVVTAGLQATHHWGLGKCPMGPLREWVPKFSREMDAWVSRRFPALFAFHVAIIGRKPE